jgi:carbonic anhydrase
MKHQKLSRRRFLRQGAALVTAGFGFGSFASIGETKPLESDRRETPEQALKVLLAGNSRFITGRTLHYDFRLERPGLVQSQHPLAIVLGCGDSRVPPELVFDQPLGRLFVVRLAGNFADEDGIASIEYGVSELGIPLIIVLGHQSCGAITAAVDFFQKKTQMAGHLPRLIDHLKPSVERAYGQRGSLLDNAIRENVMSNTAKLRHSKPIIAESIGRGQLSVLGAYYHLTTGVVEMVS